VLSWNLLQDLDASLLTVADVIRDTGHVAEGAATGQSEAALADLVGPEFSDKLIQLVDPGGHPGFRSARLHDAALPLSDDTRDKAGRGVPIFETVRLDGRERVRLVTLPHLHEGRLAQLVQVGIPLRRMDRTLAHYLQTLLVLVPLGLALAAAGGAMTARIALGPVDQMTRTARRITAEDLARRVPTRETGDELDRLAETLNAMLARLESTFGQMRRFAADAAHELRTPLTALRGGIEVALRANRSSAEYREVLGSSLEEVERVIRLAEDLLLLSRNSAGVEETHSHVELEPLALDVLDVGARLAHGTGVVVRLREATDATVLGNPHGLRRALLNLVENGVKYTPSGGRVELALSRAERHAELVVQDTGPGIEPDQAQRIFEPFVRLSAGRQGRAGGAGLGLAIARSIVIAHGGTLSLTTVPGDGCRFTIRLPLADARGQAR
jgi:heavy metal sensor kinase